MLSLIQEHTDLQDQLTSLLNDWPGQLLSATLAIGFLTMTIISYFKSLIRIPFHQKQLEEWLNLPDEILASAISSAKVYQKSQLENYANRRPDDIYNTEPRYYANFEEKGGVERLLNLTIAGDEKALYCLNIPNLSGQLALGTQTLLDNPNRYPLLLAELIGQEIDKQALHYDYVTALFGKADDRPMYREDEFNQSGELYGRTYARNRISAHIQRRIDSFQISTAYQWRKIMRLSAMLIALILSVSGSLLFAKSGHFIGLMISSIVIGYLGAFLAGLFHDLISVLKSQKR